MKLIFLSGACIVHKNKTLLLQQPETGRHPSLWGPPGGHKEGNETLIEIAKREVKEETNLDIEIKGLVQSGIKTYKGGDTLVATLYWAKPLNLKGLKVDPAEVADYKWVSLEEIRRNKYPLRETFLKPILMKALTQKPAPVDTFKIY